MKSVVVIAGARSEIFKMAPKTKVTCRMLHLLATAQQQKMVDTIKKNFAA